MNRRELDRLDALLAGGRTSRPARERILETVLRQVAAPKERRAWVGRIAGVAGVMAAACLVVWLGLPLSQAPSWREKGGDAPRATVRFGCTEVACRVGDTLVFAVANLEEPAFLSAWAVAPADDHRVWYFPTVDGAAPRAEASGPEQVLPLGAVLDASHRAASKWQVQWLLTKLPVTRQQALELMQSDAGGVVLGRGQGELTLVSEGKP